MTSPRTSSSLLAALIVVLCLLSATVARAAQEGKLLFPPDKSTVNVAESKIVGLCPTSGTVTVKVTGAKGEQSLTAQVNNGAFAQAVTLSPGENTITLSGALSATASVYLLTKETPQPPKGFKPFFQHSKGDLIAACDQCHELDPQAPNYTVLNSKKSCVSQGCHDKMGSKQFKHGPFRNNSCLECHNPHGSPNKNLAKQARAALCFSCHKENAGLSNTGTSVHFPVKQGECLLCHEHHQSEQPFHLKGTSVVGLCSNCHAKTMVKFSNMHAPFKMGDCEACHSPHVSQHKHLLVEEGTTLCLSCHKERQEEFNRRHIHGPAKKDCSVCHDPHGSEAVDHLRTPLDKNGKYIRYEQPIKETCLRCHRKSHPKLIEQMEQAKDTHQPVAEGKCTICHTPHATNFQKQLNTSLDEACNKCHEDFMKQIKESKYKHGPVRTNDCAQCHLVHGSIQPKLLRTKFTANFTENFALEHYALCFNCHTSKVYTDQLSKETGFRNGTTNLHYLHVNRKEGRTCMTCHDIHASNQPKHIRTTIPFGQKFTINLQFSKTDTGGGCVVNCHKPKQYDREKPVESQP